MDIRAVIQTSVALNIGGVEYPKIAGNFYVDEDSFIADTAIGTLIVRRADVVFAAIVADDFEFDVNDTSMIIVN